MIRDQVIRNRQTFQKSLGSLSLKIDSIALLNHSIRIHMTLPARLDKIDMNGNHTLSIFISLARLEVILVKVAKASWRETH